MSWDPATIFGANLQRWYRAADLTLNSSVSSWADHQGSGDALTQATGAAQPTVSQITFNGKTFQAVVLDGVDDRLVSATIPLTPNPTVILIGQFQSTSWAYIIDGPTKNSFAFGHTVSTSSLNGYPSNVGNFKDAVPVTAIWGIAALNSGTKQNYARENGNLGSASWTAMSATGLTVGSSGAPDNFTQCWITDILVVGTEPTSTQWAQIDSYAQDTYGITVSDYVSSGGGSASVSDSIPLATSVTRSQSQSRSTADSISLSTATTSQSTQARSVADTLAASTSASSSRGQQRRSIADSLGLSTLVSRAASAVRAIADTLGLSSSAARSQTQTRSIADSVALSTSTTSTQTTQTRATSDSISLTTSVAVSFTPASAPRNLVFRVGQPTPRWKVGQPTPSWTVGQPRPRWKVSEPN